MSRSETLRGAASGAIAAAVWAAQQPVDKLVFSSRFDDVEWLGRGVVADENFYAAGLLMHLANGAAFGAAYSRIAPRLAGPVWLKAPALALAENTALWPLVYFSDRFHPRRAKLSEKKLFGNRSAFYQATWRHLLFGAILGELERRLNERDLEEAAVITTTYSSNGHGKIEHALANVPPPAVEPED